jgi:pimeloyl-ACP methyl ester carboxylesterase
LSRAARLGSLLIFGLALAWLIVDFGYAWMYVNRLLNPTCPISVDAAPPEFQAVLLSLNDDIPLHGWWHPPENGTVVIFMGGHGANRDTFLPEAMMLAEHGYGALTLNYRHCEGKPVSLGIHEGEELRAGLAFTLMQPGVVRTAVWGFSAGGVAAIRTAADDIEIDAVISMGNYANLYDEIQQATSSKPPSMAWQIQEMVAVVLWIRTGVWPGRVDPLGDVARISPRPVFLIFGSEEVDRARGREQFASAGKPKELWVVPGAGHGEYSQAAPQEYQQRVLDFLTGLN